MRIIRFELYLPASTESSLIRKGSSTSKQSVDGSESEVDYKISVMASLAGGVVLGLLMTMTGSMAQVAGLVGSDSAFAGWVVHLVASAVLGVIFALSLGERVAAGQMPAIKAGLIYGLVWYALGALTLLPFLTGAGPQWSAAGITGSFDLLVGHLAYGAALGYAYQRLASGPPIVRKRAA